MPSSNSAVRLSAISSLSTLAPLIFVILMPDVRLLAFTGSSAISSNRSTNDRFCVIVNTGTVSPKMHAVTIVQSTIKRITYFKLPSKSIIAAKPAPHIPAIAPIMSAGTNTLKIVVTLPRFFIVLTHTDTTSPAESAGFVSITYEVGAKTAITIIVYTA